MKNGGYRLLIALLDGDNLALHVVLDEANCDPHAGVNGLLFALSYMAACALEQADANASTILRSFLLEDAARSDQDGG